MSKPINIGIDLSNIVLGGGLTHINEILTNLSCTSHSINKVVVWGSPHTLSSLPDRPWLKKNESMFLNKGILFRLLWQTLALSSRAKAEDCSVLFVPGGTYLGFFNPFVVMSQNLIPFDSGEIRRYGFSIRACKFILLRIAQVTTFRRAKGIIFLTHYAMNSVLRITGRLNNAKISVIPHGVSSAFFSAPVIPKNIEMFSNINLFKLIYVSNIDLYKHQGRVMEAVKILKDMGYPISIDFIGPSTTKALNQLILLFKKYDPKGEWSNYHGSVEYGRLNDFYNSADLAIFASSCETFGITLLEKMAAGLPIACSKLSCMPEILQEGGLYFNPEDADDIAFVLRRYLDSTELRRSKQLISSKLAENFSWKKCAESTFSFIKEIATDTRQ